MLSRFRPVVLEKASPKTIISRMGCAVAKYSCFRTEACIAKLHGRRIWGGILLHCQISHINIQPQPPTRILSHSLLRVIRLVPHVTRVLLNRSTASHTSLEAEQCRITIIRSMHCPPQPCHSFADIAQVSMHNSTPRNINARLSQERTSYVLKERLRIEKRTWPELRTSKGYCLVFRRKEGADSRR